MKRGLRERIILLLPATILTAVVVVVPLTRVVYLSFTRVDASDGLRIQWAGAEPYFRSWQDGRFLSSLTNTVLFSGASVSLELLLGTSFALLLNRRFRARSFVRAAVLLPWALPTAVMGLGWAWIFNDQFGVANDLLMKARLIPTPIAWLAEPGPALVAITIADVWKTTPFVTLVVLAGLQGIPAEVLEAAEIDGAGPFQRFRLIVLPLLVPSLLVAALFRGIQAFSAFDIVYVMTGGGPGGSTETLSLYSFQNYFRYLDFGYGSTIAVQGALLLLLAASVVKLMTRRWEGG